jgi:hypothetical protein
MSDPEDAPEVAPRPRQTGAAEKPRAPDTNKGKGKPTREERLAKALRENLKRRKASAKKD